MKRRAVLIAGPTASGKSALALRLAAALNGVILNADSMQVYRDLRIITARPSRDEEASVPHRLFGHVDASVTYSVARWLTDATKMVAAVEDAGHLPIIVGGTGLYFRALLDGLSDIPPVPDSVRVDLRAWADGQGATTVHARLAVLDPKAATLLNPNDTQRMLRALEVVMATGRSLIDWQSTRSGQVLKSEECAAVFLSPDRDRLRHRIDDRFDAMMAEGALDEVRSLMARDLDPALPAMRAHGVPGLIRALKGEETMAQAIERGKADTRQYAKRQHTWFRHQAPEFVWVQPEEAEAHLVAQFGMSV